MTLKQKQLVLVNAIKLLDVHRFSCTAILNAQENLGFRYNDCRLCDEYGSFFLGAPCPCAWIGGSLDKNFPEYTYEEQKNIRINMLLLFKESLSK